MERKDLLKQLGFSNKFLDLIENWECYEPPASYTVEDKLFVNSIDVNNLIITHQTNNFSTKIGF
jgi:hypothetical protein